MKNAMRLPKQRACAHQAVISLSIWFSRSLNSVTKRFELPVRQSKHQADRFQLHPEGPCRRRGCLGSRDGPRDDRLSRRGVEYSQHDFIGVRQRREQPGDCRVHILEALLHEPLRRSLGRQALIPRMNFSRLPFHFETIAHALERKSVVADSRATIHFERADHFAPKSLLSQVPYKSFCCPYHDPVPSS